MSQIDFSHLIPRQPGADPALAPPEAPVAESAIDFSVLTPGAGGASAGVGDYAAEALKGFGAAPRDILASGMKGMAADAALFARDRLSTLDDADAGPVDDSPEARAAYRLRRGVVHPSPEVTEQRRAELQKTVDRPITQNPLWKAGEALGGFGQEMLAPAPGWEKSWTRDIAGGFGSVGAGIAVGMLNPAAAMLMFVSAGQGEAAERALKAGATPEQIERAARLGTVAGATDVVDALLPALGSTGKAMGFLKRVGYRTVAGALAEGGQEGLQQLIQNAIAKGIYKPDQDLLEDVPRNMAVGAIVGGSLGPVIGHAGPKDAAGAGAAEPQAPQAPAQQAPQEPFTEPQQAIPAPAQIDDAPAIPAEDLKAQQALADFEDFLNQRAPVEAEPTEPAERPNMLGRLASDLADEESIRGGSSVVDSAAPDRTVIAEDAGREIVAKPGGGAITYLSPDQIKVDAKRFQFKGNSDEKGVTGALKGVTKWDDRLANPILAWESADGEVFVANGHQRTDLAKRAQTAGQEDVRLPARILRESDGFTPEHMRALGAFQNIAEGTGTAVDAAKMFRSNLADLDMPELPPRSQLVQDAKALAVLGDDAFGMVVNGMVPESYAAQVGRLVKDPGEQLAAMDALAKAQPANVDQARIMVEDIRNAGFERNTQTGLFGEEEFTRSLIAERARILDAAIKTLRRLGSTFKTAVEQEGTLAEAGNKMSRDANAKARTENERLAEILRIDGTRQGPISTSLSEFAIQLADGKRINAVTAQFLAQVRSLAKGIAANDESRAAADRDGPSSEEGQGTLYSAGAGQQRPVGRPASWVIKDKATGSVIMETFDRKKVDALNTAKYEAVPIADHLRSLNNPQKPKPETVELAKGQRGDQFVIPGAEREGQGVQAQRRADAPLKPKVAQKKADVGLFGDEKDQGSLFSVGDGRKPKIKLPMDYKSRMERAREMGFDPDERWYHGTARSDRLTEKGKLDPRRATSGPMPFFTNDPELASSYATKKSDTSLEIPESYSGWFKYKPEGSRSKVDLDSAWHFLPQEERARISAMAPRIGFDDSGESIVVHGPDHKNGIGSYDWEIQQARGNAFKALNESWLASGALFDQEERFLEVLRLAGAKGIEYDSPHRQEPGVLPVLIRSGNPLRTDDIAAIRKMLPEMEAMAKRSRRKAGYGRDLWDKNTITPRDFIERLRNDLDKGETHSWTSIPDEITAFLRSKGYDSIRDKGGKQGGKEHDVLIPFTPQQVRSVNAKFDPDEWSSDKLLFDARSDLAPRAQAKRPQLERQLTALVRRIAGDNVNVAFPDEIALPTAASKAWGSYSKGRQTAAGSYLPAQRLISIALADPRYTQQGQTALHESFHAVEHLLLNDREMAVLKKAEPELRKIVQDYADLTPEQTKGLADYEVRAVAFEAFAEARANKQPVTSFPGAVRMVFDKLRNLFDRVRNALNGMGFKTAEDVFTDVYQGKMAERAPSPRPIGEAAQSNVRGDEPITGNRATAVNQRISKLNAELKTLLRGTGVHPMDLSLNGAHRKRISAEAAAAFDERQKLVEEWDRETDRIDTEIKRLLTPDQPRLMDLTINKGLRSQVSPQVRALLEERDAWIADDDGALASIIDPSPSREERRDVVKKMDFRPIDRALRVPFDIFGGTNSKGEWKPGLYLNKQAARIITDAKFSPGGRFNWLNPTLERARTGLVDRYGLDPEYVERERQRGLDERRIMAQVPEIMNTLKEADVTPSESVLLQGMLTGKPVDSEKLSKLAAPIRLAIDQFGQEAVDLGLLSPEAYERNRGAYLHRVYRKYETDQNALAKWVSQLATSRRKKIIGNQFKGRGLWQEISAEKIGNPAKGTKIERGGQTWEVRGRKGPNAVLWRDYTEDERQKMGEILDARYTIAKTYMTMAHDLATGRFYKDISENDDWATSEEPPKGTWKNAGEYGRFWTDPSVEWVKVPNTKIADSDTLRYAALADKFVRAEIWRDINELEKMQSPRFWTALLSQWKLNKTARSPVTHMNNVMSNVLLADMSDVRARDLASGVRSMIRNDKTYQEAVDNGTFGGDMVSQEIRDNVLKPVLEEIEKASTAHSPIGAIGKLAEGIFSKGALIGASYGATAGFALAGPAGAVTGAGLGAMVGSAARKPVEAFDRKMIDAYRLEDEVFRMAAYVRRREQGMSPKDAAIEANEQFMNYDIRAPWVNAARRTVLPFLAYTYRAAPIVAKTVMTRPWKIAKYATAAYILNALGYALFPGDEDEERRSMRKEEQGKTWLGGPRMMRMPFGDKDGNPVFLDIRRWVPAGDIFDINQGQGALPVPAPLQFGGPLMLGAELALNKQAFTGKPIVNDKTDDMWDKGAKIGDWAWKSWMPSAAWVPGSWYWEKISNAATGARDRMGRPYDVGNAVASSVGIKLKAQDKAEGFDNHRRAFNTEERELRSEASRLSKDYGRGLMTSKQFEQQMGKIVDKRQNLNKRRVETFGGKNVADED